MTTQTTTGQESRREPAAGAGPPVKPARILVVEDNRDILRATQRILAAQNYEIFTAMDGEQALAVARESLPDIILLDVMLPRLDGLEVCRRLKSDPLTGGIMIILVTGRGSVDHRVEGFDAGADDYVPKPFHLPELLARIRSALRLKRLTDDLAQRNRDLLKSQKELIQTQDDLIQKEKMATIGLLAAGIAHEFNNIMAGISGYAQLAKKDPQYRETLIDVALMQTERALELTRSLSTYNRSSIDKADCDVVKVIESALCLVAKEIERTSIRMVKEFLVAPRVALSPGQFQEIILNLAINAIQAIEHDQGEIRIKVGPSRNPDEIEVEVSDNGKGIAEEHLSRIFDPFFTTKGALGGGHQSGTGLGLTVCYNIIHSHGGDIEVASKVGKGAMFKVRLPRAPETPRCEGPAAMRAPPRRREAAAEPLRILVIDDEEAVRDLLTAYLKGHRVVACAKAEAAFAALASETFDFVLLDICIEGSVNGFQIFERVRALDPAPRVIFASGRFPDANYRAYLERAHGHLLKPYKFEALAALLGITEPELETCAAAAP